MNGKDPQKDSQFESLQKNKFSGSEVLGVAQKSQYKSSNEQQRFARQVERDLARSSGRLSQSVIRKLISEDTSKWAKSIFDQKLSQNAANNNSSLQSQSASPTTQSSVSQQPSGGSIGVGGGGVQNSAGANNDTVGGQGEVPEGSALGDLLYWGGSEWLLFSPSGIKSLLYWDGGNWISLEPEGEEAENFLYWDGSSWLFAATKEFEVCEEGESKKYKIPAIEVEQ
jgi:hypothetical protein